MPFHVGMRFCMKLDALCEARRFDPPRRRADGLILHIKGDHPAVWPHTFRQENRVVAVARGGIDDVVAITDRRAQQCPGEFGGARRHHGAGVPCHARSETRTLAHQSLYAWMNALWAGWT